MKGLDVGETYLNTNSAKSFVHFIAEEERGRMTKEYANAKFLAVLSDGSTDSAVVEEEIVYVRFAVAGKINTHFVSLQPVQKADAETISQAVSTAISVNVDPDWKDKLVAIATDGASVMLGKDNGVVKKLKGDRQHVISVHCMNHRLELSFKDTASKNAGHQKLQQLLLWLYLFYHKSALNRANLKNSYASLNMKPLMPTRTDGTRWVGHLWRALDHFLKGYRAIIQHLEQVLNFSPFIS